MTWIVDIELVGIAPAEPPDALEINFDVIYPGETWCRSVVAIAPGVTGFSDDELVRRARDALLGVVEQEGEPVSVRLRLARGGAEVLALGRPR